MMRLIVCDNQQEIACLGADMIAEVVKAKPEAVLGLATGSSPVPMYGELVRRYKAGELDFSTVRSVNLDEYYPLAPDNDQSYRYFMNEHLFHHVNIDKNNTHVPDGLEADADAACSAYERLIKESGGIDFQLLGLGHNGHIGFNEPCDSFEKETHCVDLTESTIQANARFFKSMDEVPKQAYTMGIKSILSAKTILVMVSGTAKADIVKKAFFGPVTPQVPASVLQLHKDVILVGDEDALREVME